jgi:glutaredoxin/glutathione-dependent peroxiredoxin
VEETSNMTIKVGDRVPSATLRYLAPDGPKQVSSEEFFGGKKVALFAVPGAFTRTCSQRHLPSYVANAAALKAKGVDTVACIAVNDQFVMGAWGKEHGAGDIVMLGDGSGEFAHAVGLELDRIKEGMGMRSQRYSMLVEDGVVKQLNIEPAGQYGVSSAETLLTEL